MLFLQIDTPRLASCAELFHRFGETCLYCWAEPAAYSPQNKKITANLQQPMLRIFVSVDDFGTSRTNCGCPQPCHSDVADPTRRSCRQTIYDLSHMP